MLRGGFMSKSRREFLSRTSLGLVAAAVAPGISVAEEKVQHSQEPAQPAPGTPPAFGTGPAIGPEVSPATFAEAEKLVQVELTGPDRTLASESWRVNLASVYERRIGPRKVAVEPSVAPWSRYVSALPGERVGPQRDRFLRTAGDPGPLPANDADIAVRFTAFPGAPRICWTPLESPRPTAPSLTGIVFLKKTPPS